MQELNQAGLNLNYIGGSIYMGGYSRPRDDIEAWVRPKVEA